MLLSLFKRTNIHEHHISLNSCTRAHQESCLKGSVSVTAALQRGFPFVRSLFPLACSSLLFSFLWCVALSPAQSTQWGIIPYHSARYPRISSPGLRCSFPLKILFSLWEVSQWHAKRDQSEWILNAAITHLSCCLSINTPSLAHALCPFLCKC